MQCGKRKSTPGKVKQSLPPYSILEKWSLDYFRPHSRQDAERCFRQHTPWIFGIGRQLISLEGRHGKQLQFHLLSKDKKAQSIDRHTNVIVILCQEFRHIHRRTRVDDTHSVCHTQMTNCRPRRRPQCSSLWSRYASRNSKPVRPFGKALSGGIERDEGASNCQNFSLFPPYPSA